ncbi:hypothetical protein SAMN04488028_104284 [Reichenbachiella agariperforans]|uniref:Uncharacterized protein n=1 Tax=Reichenbachiella agariperforans TaxID=156994 RepID=A0A1M6RT39_REIAG|nr:hypothetical protein SAMN04488028_104284 [Reichenbachiella agariperforans]
MSFSPPKCSLSESFLTLIGKKREPNQASIVEAVLKFINCMYSVVL